MLPVGSWDKYRPLRWPESCRSRVSAFLSEPTRALRALQPILPMQAREPSLYGLCSSHALATMICLSCTGPCSLLLLVAVNTFAYARPLTLLHRQVAV